MCGWPRRRLGKSSVNFCRERTVGNGAGESRKLLSMDSSVGAILVSEPGLWSFCISAPDR
jgi:hypothetical protein